MNIGVPFFDAASLSPFSRSSEVFSFGLPFPSSTERISRFLRLLLSPPPSRCMTFVSFRTNGPTSSRLFHFSRRFFKLVRLGNFLRFRGLEVPSELLHFFFLKTSLCGSCRERPFTVVVAEEMFPVRQAVLPLWDGSPWHGPFFCRAPHLPSGEASPLGKVRLTPSGT